MSTSIQIHDVTSIYAGAVFHTNANAVTLHIQTERNGSFAITVFNLPTEDADHLAAAIGPGARYTSEAAIRADERAKVTARLASLIGEAA